MKNIEDLVSKGIIFTDAHATPLCAPSRYSFLSGNYQFRGAGSQNGKTTAVNWGLVSSGQFKKGQESIADIFANAGYNTAMVGKWHVGGKVLSNGRKSAENILTHPDHDWTQPFGGGPQDISFKSSLITIQGIQAAPYAWFRDGILQTKKTNIKYWTNGLYSMPHGTSKINVDGEGDVDWDSTAYHMILVNEIMRFLDDHLDKTPDDPFFAYFASGSVHVPHSPPKQYIDGAAIDKTQYNAHMDMLFELDLVVGSLVQALQDRSLLEDTIIVFTSDNGGLDPRYSDNSASFGHLTNGRLRGFKSSLYEGGHTVPMIMRYDKGLPSGQTRDHLIGITDLYATLAEMAGISIPDSQAIDSISFANYARDGNNAQNLREYYGIWSIPNAEKDIKKGCAIRSSDHYKLIYSFNSSTNEWISELYNLKMI